MKKFLETTQDRIEQLFASKILVCFPYYGEFWEKFIGLRPGNRLLPYRLQVPSEVKKKDKKQLLRGHEEISMRHYTLFCQLAGAHFQLEKATDSLAERSEAMRHFLFWEAFDNFYQHLGNARNQMYGIWDVVHSLSKCLPDKLKLKDYLECSGQKVLREKLNRWEGEAKTLRDDIVHFARGGAPYGDGTYWIPVPLRRKRRNMRWSETLSNSVPVQEATKKMEKDLRELESILDAVQRLIGDELQKTFQAMGVVICYE